MKRLQHLFFAVLTIGASLAFGSFRFTEPASAQVQLPCPTPGTNVTIIGVTMPQCIINASGSAAPGPSPTSGNGNCSFTGFVLTCTTPTPLPSPTASSTGCGLLSWSGLTIHGDTTACGGGGGASPCPTGNAPGCVALQVSSSPSPQTGNAAITGVMAQNNSLYAQPTPSGRPAGDSMRVFVGGYAAGACGPNCDGLFVFPEPTSTASLPPMDLLQLGCGGSGNAVVCGSGFPGDSTTRIPWRIAMSYGNDAHSTYIGTDASQDCPDGVNAGVFGVGFSLSYSLGQVCVDGNGLLDTSAFYMTRDVFSNYDMCLWRSDHAHGLGLCMGDYYNTASCDGSQDMYLFDTALSHCYFEGNVAGPFKIFDKLVDPGGVQPNGASGGYAPEVEPGGAMSTHPREITFGCAVSGASTACSFPNSFSFADTTYKCNVTAEGTTPVSYSYVQTSTSQVTIYPSPSATATADTHCTGV